MLSLSPPRVCPHTLTYLTMGEPKSLTHPMCFSPPLIYHHRLGYLPKEPRYLTHSTCLSPPLIYHHTVGYLPNEPRSLTHPMCLSPPLIYHHTLGYLPNDPIEVSFPPMCLSLLSAIGCNYGLLNLSPELLTVTGERISTVFDSNRNC